MAFEKKDCFVWETHAIHVGTGNDHVKHGIDELEDVVEKAISLSHPDICFVIHSPRMTHFRYEAEKNTDIKFIRGHKSFVDYPNKIAALREKYGSRIKIRYGIELEWLGSGIGLQWNRSKLFQAKEYDFVIGSVHFSREGIAYDGSIEESAKLLEMRGGVENYWLGYIEELIEMIDCVGSQIQIIGHLDLPKLYVPIPPVLLELDTSDHILARRMRYLLEMIADNNLALDVNMAGYRKKCGIYPNTQIMKRAKELHIGISIGTDAHNIKDLGTNYALAIEYCLENRCKHYLSFSRCIPEKHPLSNPDLSQADYDVLNVGIEMLNSRFKDARQRRLPNFSFGGKYLGFKNYHRNSVSLGAYNAMRIRKGEKSITISEEKPCLTKLNDTALFSCHKDSPGVLSVLFNTLASEGINVETALLNSNCDGTATAFLQVTGSDKQINEAIEFVKGTSCDDFFDIKYGKQKKMPSLKKSKLYLHELDGVQIPVPLSKQMLITRHNNEPGVLLILLSALASYEVNVLDMQLAKRGQKAYAALGIEGNKENVNKIIKRLGPQFFETSYIELNKTL